MYVLELYTRGITTSRLSEKQLRNLVDPIRCKWMFPYRRRYHGVVLFKAAPYRVVTTGFDRRCKQVGTCLPKTILVYMRRAINRMGAIYGAM